MRPAEMSAVVDFLQSLRADGPAKGQRSLSPGTRGGGIDSAEEPAMSPLLDAFLRSWPFDPWLFAARSC